VPTPIQSDFINTNTSLHRGCIADLLTKHALAFSPTKPLKSWLVPRRDLLNNHRTSGGTEEGRLTLNYKPFAGSLMDAVEFRNIAFNEPNAPLRDPFCEIFLVSCF